MSDISRNEICLDVELEGAIPMSVPPADAYILYVERAENAAASAESSATAAVASASAAKTSETNAANSAKEAESSANKAKDIADNLEGLDGIAGIATTEEAVAGESDDKIMTPSKVKKAIEAQVPIKEIVNSIYPVGQIVEYASDINPNDLYSWQTWKQIKDVFTLAAGDKYTIGNTGGAATVTLTIDQIPAHGHTATASNDGEHIHSGVAKRNINWQAKSDWTSDSGNLVASEGNTDNAGGHSHKIEIQNTGGDAAHNNMPPYLVTIKWKRTS